MKLSFTYKRLAVAMALVCVCVIVLAVWLNRGTGIPVLNYHEVEDNVDNPLALNTKDFEEQMAYLHTQGYHSITPNQLLAHLKTGAPLPDKPILITFDDGYQDNYTHAYPIMKKYGFTGTVFLITDVVGNNDWYLNWNQIKEMQQDGFVFGSHTLNHVPLTDLSRDEVLRQLKNSKEGIEWRLGRPVTVFAYPRGSYNRAVEELVQSTGYAGAFSVEFGQVGRKSDLYALERIPIFQARFAFYDFYFRLHFTAVAAKVRKVVRPLWHMVNKAHYQEAPTGNDPC